MLSVQKPDRRSFLRRCLAGAMAIPVIGLLPKVVDAGCRKAYRTWRVLWVKLPDSPDGSKRHMKVSVLMSGPDDEKFWQPEFWVDGKDQPRETDCDKELKKLVGGKLSGQTSTTSWSISERPEL